MNNPLARQKLEALTSLRFFAASLVFVFHFGQNLVSRFPWWIQSLATHGLLAVSFFFVLSGFILAYSYLSPTDDLKVNSPRAFWQARFARIYPLYAVALLIGFPVYLYATIRGRNNPASSIGGFLFVPLMLQSWISPIAIEWNPPAWSLSVEAAFYLVFPLLVRRLKGRGGWGIIVAAVVLSCVGTFLNQLWWRPEFDILHPVVSRNDSLRNFLLYFPLLHAPAFLIGVGTGKLFIFGRAQEKTISASAGFYGSASIVASLLFLRPVLPPWIYSQPVTISLFAAVIYFAARRAGNAVGSVLSHPWLVRLGDASYGLYLLQAPLADWFLFATRPFVADWKTRPALVLLFFAVVTIVSLLAFTFIETPCRHWLRQRFQVRTQALETRTPTITIS